ncbi:helix-turn-helix domain-containing protein [Fructobacillus cardui]|uniref:helix-turn-helix domain-containing protein n=1 Tax=Fructobacillus cardui TaxID=2893170 RepID=UPI00200AC68A|nr:helix-turn-helix domain-containing protein [Fructobacillus cardui]MCK8627648.1 helix-turn-helix domain-containing protein [Fructobacillus cardui]
MKNNRIRELREKKKLTLKELAKNIGVSFTTLSKYENGVVTTGKIATWQKLADFFGVSVGHLQGLPLFDEYKNNLTDITEKFSDYNNEYVKQKKELDELKIQYKLLANKFDHNMATNEDFKQKEKILEKIKDLRKNINYSRIELAKTIQQLDESKDILSKELETIDTLIKNNKDDDK